MRCRPCRPWRQRGSGDPSFAHRGDRLDVGLPGPDANGALQRDDEDLAVADLAGARAGAERVDGGLHERIGDGDLEADLLREPDLHGGAAVRLDTVELA